MSDPGQNQGMSTGQMLAATRSSSDGDGGASGGGASGGSFFEGKGLEMQGSSFDGFGNSDSAGQLTNIIGNLGSDEKHFAKDQEFHKGLELTSMVNPIATLSSLSLLGSAGSEAAFRGANFDSTFGSGENPDGSVSEGSGGDDGGGSAFAQSSVGNSGMQYENDIPMAQMGGFTPDSTPSVGGKAVEMAM